MHSAAKPNSVRSRPAFRAWRYLDFRGAIDEVSSNRGRLALARLDSCGAARRGVLQRRYFGCRGRSGAERRALDSKELARQAEKYQRGTHRYGRFSGEADE